MLWNEIIFRTRLAVIIRPTIHCWNFSWPVTVLRVARCCPLQCSRVPRVGRSQSSAENAIEEVEQENKLRRQRYDCRDTHQHIQVSKSAKGFKVCECIIS